MSRNQREYSLRIRTNTPTTTRLTYSEMGTRVAAVAQHILQHLVSMSLDPASEVIVSVVMHKGWEQIVGALAVLTCNATYLPIDAKWPSKRAAQIIQASGTCLVVTMSNLMEDDQVRTQALSSVPVVLVDVAIAKHAGT